MLRGEGGDAEDNEAERGTSAPDEGAREVGLLPVLIAAGLTGDRLALVAEALGIAIALADGPKVTAGVGVGDMSLSLARYSFRSRTQASQLAGESAWM